MTATAKTKIGCFVCRNYESNYLYRYALDASHAELQKHTSAIKSVRKCARSPEREKANQEQEAMIFGTLQGHIAIIFAVPHLYVSETSLGL